MLDVKEAELLAQFRKELVSLLTDENRAYLKLEDHFLMRWLRARNLDVEKAKVMLQNYLNWRRTNKDLKLISSGTWTPPKMITEHVKLKLTGHDYEGRPIFWTNGGRWELGQIHDAGLRDDLVRFSYSIMDNRISAEVEKQRKEKNVTQFIFVIDAAGMTLRKALHLETAQTRIRFIRELEAYFPEILHSCYILNGHWVITNLYNILRPFISSRTQSKVCLFGTNQEQWQSALRNKFPLASIPQDYGGSGEMLETGLPYIE